MSELEHLTDFFPRETDRRAINAAADLPTTLARSEQPTLNVGGVRHHSAVDPVAEAQTLMEELAAELRRAAAGGTLTVIIPGPGLGYLVKALDSFARRELPGCRVEIHCLEAEPTIARAALRLRVWQPVSVRCVWSLLDGQDTMPANPESTLIVRATPGYRAAKSRYEAVLKGAPESAPRRDPLRILVPTPMYGGSYPIATYCASALRQLGHTVEELDLAEFNSRHLQLEQFSASPAHRRALQGLHVTLLAEMIVARALDFRADLVWAVAQTPLTLPALAELRQSDIRTAFWFVEDFRVFDYWSELAPHYDAVFTIQRGEFLTRLSTAGVRHAEYLPLAADPAIHRPLSLSAADRRRYGSDTSFVGAGYLNRRTTFERLRLPGFKLWGNDWPTQGPLREYVQEDARRLDTEDCVKVFNATAINLNLHSSSRASGVDPDGDFVNPRTFEVAATGAFQLVDRRQELPQLFAEGEELITFDRVEQVPELIAYYTAHPAARARISAAARQRVLREHTYVHRMSTALERLSQWFPQLARKHGLNYRESLLQAAAGDRELTEFLSAFAPDRELSLDDIVARIESTTGTLTRPEAMFLLMKEFRDWGVERGVIA